MLNHLLDVMTVGGDFDPCDSWVNVYGVFVVTGVVGVVQGGDVGGVLDAGIVIGEEEGSIISLGLPCLDNVVQVVFKLLTRCVVRCCCGLFLFLQVTGKGSGQQTRQATAAWKVSRVVGTLQPGVSFNKDGSKGPELCMPDDSTVRVTGSLGRQQVLMTCVGCERGRQHFRVCTCKSVTHHSDLWCPVCMYSEQQWEGAGKRVLPACELRFTAVLVQLGLDTQFALQTPAPFWQWPLDARHLQQGYFVQIDGDSHWRGMRGQSRNEVLARDMQQNVAAMRAGGVLVRIHSRDLECTRLVLAALQAAALGYSIVLSPSCAVEPYNLNGATVPYVCALLLQQANCCWDRDVFGNCRLWLL
jgi:hypothetical protein